LGFDREPAVEALLDGAWSPRSRGAVAAQRSLVLAVDAKRAPITSIMRNPEGWRGHPGRFDVADRTVRVLIATTRDLVAAESS
jgi:hypothetical protein